MLAVLLGCPSDDKDEPKTEPKAATPAKTKPAQPVAPGDPVELPKIEGPVAKVNGVELPAEQFLKEYKATLDRYARARHPVKPELRERLKENLVRRLVDAEIIRQKAKELKVEIPPAELDEKWQAHKKRYGDDKAFESFLQRAGTSEADVRDQFTLNLIREKVFASVSEGIAIEDKDVQDYYEQNKRRYNEPEQVKASHILIRVDANSKPEAKAEKKKLAQSVHAKAKKKGADFAKLAEEHGEDPTRSRGGDLGFFTRGRMVKAFEDAVWDMKEGQISDIVETNFGFHIIKKMGHKKAYTKTFEDVKPQIERAVRARKRNTVIREALQKWKDDSQIEIIVKGDPKILEAAKRSKKPRLDVRPKDPGTLLPVKKVPPPSTSDKPVGSP